jgi:ribosomal protein L7/L12
MNLDFKFFTVTITVSGGVKRKVKQALRENETPFNAIKKYRELTGSSLKDAVEYVNALLPADKRIGQKFGK